MRYRWNGQMRYGRWALAVALAVIVAGGAALALRGGDDGSAVPEDELARPASTGGTAERSVASDDATTSEQYAPASGVAPAAPGEGGRPAPAALTDTRKIVRTASVDLRVEDVGNAFQQVDRIASGAGGFVADSSFSSRDAEHQSATVTVRVPADRYAAVLAELRELGVRVEAESSSANDVTADFTDLEARLRALEAAETQLLGFMARAANIDEVLQVQDRLNAVRVEIEQVQGQMNLLERLSDLATITVGLQPVTAARVDAPGGDTTIGEAVADAWESSLDFLEEGAVGVLTVVVFSWWLVPLAVAGGLALRRFGRGRPATAAPEA